MAIDTSIYSNIKPVQIDSPVNALAQVTQLRQAQNQNRLFDMQVADKESARNSENALSAAYQSALNPDGTIDSAKLLSGVANAGQGSKLPSIQKGLADQDKATADADKSKWDVQSKKLDVAGQAFGYVRNNPTLENANATLDYLAANGVYDAATVAKYKQAVASNPAAIKQLADQAFQSVLSAKDQLATFQTRNTGGTTDTISTNPVTGKVEVVNSVRNTQSPDSIASNATAIRGQNMTDARSREATNAGKVPSGYRANPDGTLSAIPGGPADTSTGVSAKPTADYLKQAEAYQNMDDAITGYTGILKNFGLIDAANPTKRAELDSAYQNALLQAKEIYKLGVLNGGDERIIKGVINRPLDLSSAFIPKEALIKQATDLQGIIKRGNENLAKVNKQKVVPLNSEAAAATTPSASTQKAGGTMSVTNAADYAKVPSGALYVTPDGQTRKKP